VILSHLANDPNSIRPWWDEAATHWRRLQMTSREMVFRLDQDRDSIGFLHRFYIQHPMSDDRRVRNKNRCLRTYQNVFLGTRLLWYAERHLNQFLEFLVHIVTHQSVFTWNKVGGVAYEGAPGLYASRKCRRVHIQVGIWLGARLTRVHDGRSRCGRQNRLKEGFSLE